MKEEKSVSHAYRVSYKWMLWLSCIHSFTFDQLGFEMWLSGKVWCGPANAIRPERGALADMDGRPRTEESQNSLHPTIVQIQCKQWQEDTITSHSTHSLFTEQVHHHPPQTFKVRAHPHIQPTTGHSTPLMVDSSWHTCMWAGRGVTACIQQDILNPEQQITVHIQPSTRHGLFDQAKADLNRHTHPATEVPGAEVLQAGQQEVNVLQFC